MKNERFSGLLMHPTSLPGPYGIGDFGSEAYRFTDFLAAASVKLWQVLPLGPTGYGNSPYSSRSTFAGNILLISLDLLAEDGLIDRKALQAYPDLSDTLRIKSSIGHLICRQYPKLALIAVFIGPQMNRICTSRPVAGTNLL